MKKAIRIIALTLAMAFLITGCGANNKANETWYEGTINYYKEGFANGWKNEEPDYYITDEMKDKNNKFGYLLRDLDGDGINEVLIGLIDGSSETKFTDIIILHKDFGPYRSFSCGEGYYIYLYDDNVIRCDKWYGSETQTDYMKYDSKNNSFPIVDGGSKPGRYDLIEF